MPKVQVVLVGVIASARAVTVALRWLGVTGRARTQLVVGAMLFTAALLAVIVYWGGR